MSSLFDELGHFFFKQDVMYKTLITLFHKIINLFKKYRMISVNERELSFFKKIMVIDILNIINYYFLHIIKKHFELG